MSEATAGRSVLREEGRSDASVGYAELFFDLVALGLRPAQAYDLDGHHCSGIRGAAQAGSRSVQ